MDLENISYINYAKSKDQRKKKKRDWLKMGDLQKLMLLKTYLLCG